MTSRRVFGAVAVCVVAASFGLSAASAVPPDGELDLRFEAARTSTVAVGTDGSVVLTGQMTEYEADTWEPSQGAYQSELNADGDDIFVRRVDPTGRTIFNTLLGGYGMEEVADAVVADDGSVWLTGYSVSLDFPHTAGAIDPDYEPPVEGGPTGFLAHLSADGTSLLYSTRLPGTSWMRAIALHSDGLVSVAGQSYDDFTPTDGANTVDDSADEYGPDAFVMTIDPAAGSIVSAAELGGASIDDIGDMAVTEDGGVVVTGWTQSKPFSTTDDAFQTERSGGEDAFVARLTAEGKLAWSTLLGGHDPPPPYTYLVGERGQGIVLQPNGDVWVTGSTDDKSFPIAGGGQVEPAEYEQGYGWLAKLSADGSQLEFSTQTIDNGRSLARDRWGRLHVLNLQPDLSSPDDPVMDGTWVHTVWDFRGTGGFTVAERTIAPRRGHFVRALAVDSAGTGYAWGWVEDNSTAQAFTTTMATSATVSLRRDAACTVVGTSGPDTLVGTPGPDVICGRGGSDHIEGRSGPDLLRGGDGADRITGGDGIDVVNAGAGANVVYGGDHRDLLIGGTGKDELRGGSGPDSIYGLGSADVVYGNVGADDLHGGDGDDRLLGGSGSDRISGGPGDDILRGGLQRDRCDGNGGRNHLSSCET